MQKWSSLPTEILIHVISLVGKNDNVQERIDDLSQCAVTCRNWREIAQPILFSKITIKDFETASENLCHLMMNNDRLGTYVKKLKSDSRVRKATSLITMDSLFPNLERIELQWGEGYNYPFFCKLIGKGRFCNLTYVPPFLELGEFGKFADMYLECIFTLKAQITKVYLRDDDSQGGFCKFLRMCDELCNFPKLQSVFIGPFFDESPQTIMDYVESITSQQYNLIHLEKIKIQFNDPDCLPLPLEKIHTIQPSTKIKDIDMFTESSSGGQFILLLYIMKKFPSLCRIQLYCDLSMHPLGNDFLTQEYTRQRTTATLQFLQYLCQIQDCHVSDIFALENPGSLIRDLLLQVKIKPPRIHITYADKYDYPTRNRRRPIKAFINVNKDVIDGEHTVSVKFNKEPAAEFEQLHLNLFQEAGRLFTELTLATDTACELISVVNYSAKYCHKLEKLEIRANYLPDNSLTVLKRWPDSVENYSVKELRVSALNKLTFNQLVSISATFQCLENLIIDNFLLALRRDFTTIGDKKYLSIFLNKNCSLKYININTTHDESYVFPGLSGIHVNVTTDSGQNSCVSLSIKRKDRAGKTVRVYLDPLRGDENMSSSTKDKDWITCQIHCKSIEKLDIVFRTTETKNEKERVVLRTHTLLF